MKRIIGTFYVLVVANVTIVAIGRLQQHSKKTSTTERGRKNIEIGRYFLMCVLLLAIIVFSVFVIYKIFIGEM